MPLATMEDYPIESKIQDNKDSLVRNYNLQAYVPIPAEGVVPVTAVSGRLDLEAAVLWMDETGEDITGTLDAFVLDAVYQARITLTAKPGYAFDEGTAFQYYPTDAVETQSPDNAAGVREISNNAASYYSGGVEVEYGGNFIMNDGLITGNTNSNTGAAYGAGGVRVVDQATFTMNGGTISNNVSAFGGGVELYQNKGAAAPCPQFTMTGGVIKGNKATIGGGVYIYRGDFKKTGGTIYGDTDTTHTPDANENTSTDNNGHAIYASNKNGSYEHTWDTDMPPGRTLEIKAQDENALLEVTDSGP
jgi:hypothetical protein